MQVTIATIQSQDFEGVWDWKFFLVDGKLVFHVDHGSTHYEAGFIDALSLVNDVVLTEVDIAPFEVELKNINVDEDAYVQYLNDKVNALLPT